VHEGVWRTRGCCPGSPFHIHIQEVHTRSALLFFNCSWALYNTISHGPVTSWHQVVACALFATHKPVCGCLLTHAVCTPPNLDPRRETVGRTSPVRFALARLRRDCLDPARRKQASVMRPKANSLHLLCHSLVPHSACLKSTVLLSHSRGTSTRGVTNPITACLSSSSSSCTLSPFLLPPSALRTQRKADVNFEAGRWGVASAPRNLVLGRISPQG